MKSNHQNDAENQDKQEEVLDQEQSLDTTESINELELCQEQVNYWKDQAARSFADFDNYKKRMDREQIQWMQNAQTMVLKDLLSVVDNFERALSQKTDSTADIYAGIEMIYKSVLKLLQKYSVKEFADYNEFDPEKHEALMHADSADHKTGQIVEVLEKGYMIKEKVVRPAKVTVAK